MSKILVEYERGMPTVTSLKKQFEAFQRAYDCEFRFIKTAQVTSKDIEYSDIVVSIRGNSSLSTDIAAAAKEAGRMHIAFYDDDLLNLPVGVAITKQRLRSVNKLLSYTDLILTSNKYIGKKYAEHISSRRYVLLDTAVNKADFAVPRTTDGNKIKLLYAANKMHVELFDQYIMPIMPQLCDYYGNRISMTFIGVRPNLSLYEDRLEIHYIDSMPLEEYRNYVNAQKFDIGIAPLHVNEFCRCKYYNKFIEYTMSGIVGVYTKCEPYTFIVEDKINGFLTKNTQQGWFEKLSEAIDSTELRKSCIKNAQKQLEDDFNEAKLFGRLASDIPEFMDFQAINAKKVRNLVKAKIVYRCFRCVDIVILTLCYYQKEGIRGVIKKIREHVRERNKHK